MITRASSDLRMFWTAYDPLDLASYESTAGAEQVNEMLKWLCRIDNTDWIPPAILFMARNKSDAKALHRFFADLERLAAFLMNCRYGINERIERYGKLLDAIEQGVDLYAADSPLQLSDAECRLFVTELNGDLYRQVPKRRLYVLLRLDSALSDGSASYDHSAISIEHVLPQNPPASSQWCEWFPTQELRDRWVHRLGNLLLLNHKKNSSASNYEFMKKKTSYFMKGGVSPFPLTTQAIGESEWTLKVVGARQEKAIKELKDVWRIKADLPTDEPATNDLDEPDDDDASDDPDSERTGKDYTKFDVTINGVTQETLSKRKAVLTVVKHLCDQGVSPEEIAKLVPWRTTMFCSVDGDVTSIQFVAQQKAKVDSGDKRRYFCDDDELIHATGRTYAVTNGWGVKAFQAIQNILAKYPDKGVKCDKHIKVKE